MSLEEYISDHLIIIGAIGLGLCCLEVIFFSLFVFCSSTLCTVCVLDGVMVKVLHLRSTDHGFHFHETTGQRAVMLVR